MGFPMQSYHHHFHMVSHAAHWTTSCALHCDHALRHPMWIRNMHHHATNPHASSPSDASVQQLHSPSSLHSNCTYRPPTLMMHATYSSPEITIMVQRTPFDPCIPGITQQLMHAQPPVFTCAWSQRTRGSRPAMRANPCMQSQRPPP
mmetsp:Transcript_283/g.548  ORF Transcript_283/g.548 Transcript_283/m.548 type:complete len:147 (+) Transcript_283:946-1386(+)